MALEQPRFYSLLIGLAAPLTLDAEDEVAMATAGPADIRGVPCR